MRKKGWLEWASPTPGRAPLRKGVAAGTMHSSEKRQHRILCSQISAGLLPSRKSIVGPLIFYTSPSSLCYCTMISTMVLWLAISSYVVCYIALDFSAQEHLTQTGFARPKFPLPLGCAHTETFEKSRHASNEYQPSTRRGLENVARLCHNFETLLCNGHPFAPAQSCGERRSQPNLCCPTLYNVKVAENAQSEVGDED